jgi:hypothetical protein
MEKLLTNNSKKVMSYVILYSYYFRERKDVILIDLVQEIAQNKFLTTFELNLK